MRGVFFRAPSSQSGQSQQTQPLAAQLTELTSYQQLHLAAASSYSSDMRPPIGLEYKFDRCPILTYGTFIMFIDWVRLWVKSHDFWLDTYEYTHPHPLFSFRHFQDVVGWKSRCRESAMSHWFIQHVDSCVKFLLHNDFVSDSLLHQCIP